MLDDELVHREVRGIAGHQCRVVRPGRSRDEAISLVEGDTAGREGPAPDTCLPSHPCIDRQHNEAGEKCASRVDLSGPQTPDNFLDVDRCGRRNVVGSPQACDSGNCGPTPEEINQDR